MGRRVLADRLAGSQAAGKRGSEATWRGWGYGEAQVGSGFAGSGLRRGARWQQLRGAREQVKVEGKASGVSRQQTGAAEGRACWSKPSKVFFFCIFFFLKVCEPNQFTTVLEE